VSWKKLKLLYRKFIRDIVYQILSESTGVCGRYEKKLVFFSVHNVRSTVKLRRMKFSSASWKDYRLESNL